jgi:hypothetical protein
VGLTYLFEEEDELNDEGGEAVDAGDEVAEADEELRFGDCEEEQSDGVEAPGDLEGDLAALAVGNGAVDQQPHQRQRLRTDLLTPQVPCRTLAAAPARRTVGSGG